MPKSAHILRKIKQLTKPEECAKYLINRNPRNLENLRIAHKNSGYNLEKPGRSFWHKLSLTSSGKYVTAELIHFENGKVLEASTSEWAIKKQLFKTADTSAYTNLAKVFSQRCLESGFIEMRSDIVAVEGGKIEKFLNILKENGISLQEAPRIQPELTINRYVGRKEKPYGHELE